MSLPGWLDNVPSILITAPLTCLIMLAAFSIFRWLLPQGHADLTEEESRDYVRNIAKEVVRGGRESYSDMLESVVDAAVDTGLNAAEAKTFLNNEISVLKDEQKSWPNVTEVDRLQQAFRALSNQGYYIDFGEICCGTCGVADANAARKKNPNMPGHIFFTSQCVDAALSGEFMYFWYGAASRRYDDAKHLKVSQDLFDALTEHGLKPEWDGTSSDQVRLPINWQVRWDENRLKVA